VEADVGAPVLLEVLQLVVHLRHQLVETVELVPGSALGGEHRRPGLDRHPVVQHRPRPLVQRLPRLLGERRLRGDEGAAGPPPLRDQVAALHQRRQRLPQGRAGDLQPARQLPLRRQLAPRRQQPEPDRAPQPLDRLLERACRPHRHEYSLERGIRLHRATVAPIPILVTDRCRG
jgi:hypothetical protein